MKPILFVLPQAGFDPSEASIPWQQLLNAGEQVVFATPTGQPGAADPLMVTGEGLDPWGWIPGLKKIKLVGLFLRANGDARRAYQAMVASPAFQNPIRYDQIDPAAFDGILFPGGHTKAIKPYLESEALTQLVNRCLDGQASDRHIPMAAICHGVLVLARAKNAQGVSAIAGRQVTALTWAFEKKAWHTARLTRFWEPDYYRTYVEQPGEAAGHWGVEQEIKRLLNSESLFRDVAPGFPDYRLKTSGLHRDTPTDSRAAWVVRDGNLVTGRWPGDAHAFAHTFLQIIGERRAQENSHV